MKRIVALCLVVFLGFCLFAADISAIGYGSTAAEAQDKALEKLTERIFGTLVSNVTFSSNYEDSSGDSFGSFSSSSSSASFGSLLAVEYSTAEKLAKNSYQVTAFIRESAAPLYESELRTVSDNILRESRKTLSSLDEQKTHLLYLMGQVQLFTNYRQVLLLLGVSRSIPELPIDETYKSLSDKLQSVYTELLNQEEQKKQSSSSFVDRSKIEEQIAIYREEQEKLLESANQSQIEQSEMYKQSLMDNISKVIENSAKVSLGSANGYSLDDDINLVLKSIIQYNDITGQYEAQLASIRKDNAREVSLGVSSIESREYRLAEMSNGVPTDAAKRRRQKEVETFKAQKAQELTEQENLVTDMYKKEIQRIYDVMADNCLTVEKRTYGISSADGAVTLSSTGYDGNNCCWNIFVDSPYANSFTYNLAYKTVTGDNPADENSSDKKYDRYLDAVEAYDSKLLDLVTVTMDISVIIDAKGGQVRFENSKIQLYISKKVADKNASESSVTWRNLGAYLENDSYSWLKTKSSFNAKADSEAVKKQQIAEQQAQAAAEEAERINREILKSERYELIKRTAIETNSEFYGLDKRLIYMLYFRIRPDMGDREKIAGQEVFTMTMDFGVNIEYALTGFLYVGIEPYFTYGTTTYETEEKNDEEPKEKFYSVGAMVNGGLNILGFIGVGGKYGFSTRGSIYCVYMKFNYGNFMEFYTGGAASSPDLTSVIMELGYFKETLKEEPMERSGLVMTFGVAF